MGVLYLTMGFLIVSAILAGIWEWYIDNRKRVIKNGGQLRLVYRKMSHIASSSTTVALTPSQQRL